jgi:ComF family protein
MPFLCPNCLVNLPRTGMAAHRGNAVEKIFWGRVNIEAACSELYFTPESSVRSILHAIKYHGDRRTALHMGRMMGRSMKRYHPFNAVDAIVPLPLHPDRLRKRGYNQAELLALGIADEMNLPMRNDLLLRQRATATQTRRNRLDRWDNVQEAFMSGTDDMHEARLLLVDDVVTTGATLEAASSALLKGTNRRVCIATLAWADK